MIAPILFYISYPEVRPDPAFCQHRKCVRKLAAALVAPTLLSDPEVWAPCRRLLGVASEKV